MTILLDTALGRKDFDQGYPRLQKIAFHETQNFDLEISQIKRKYQMAPADRSGNRDDQVQQRQKPQPQQTPQKTQQKDQNSVQNPPSKPGKRVVKKQVPMPKI